MMLFQPQSELYLIGDTLLSPSYSHVLSFSSKQEQFDYFHRKCVKAMSDYTFVRKDNTIKVNGNIEDLWNINYMVYRNKTKWIYCFIIDKVYISENVTALVLKTDVWNTYQFDYSLGECFVLREHVEPTSFELLDEGFDLGSEYKITNKQTVFEKDSAYLVILGDIKKPVFMETISTTQIGDGSTAEEKFVRRAQMPDIYEDPLQKSDDIEYFPTSETVATVLNKVPYPFLFIPTYDLQLFAWLGYLNKSQSVVGIVKTDKYPSISTRAVEVPYLDGDGKVKELNVSVLSHSSTTLDYVEEQTNIIEDVQPFASGDLFNNYPYSYSMLTDYVNTPMIVKHEYLNSKTFRAKHSYGTEPTSRYYIEGYAGDTNGEVHNITTNIVNSIPFSKDAFSQYLFQSKNSVDESLRQAGTQSQLGMLSGAVNSVVGAVGGFAIGGVGGAVAGGFGGAMSGVNSYVSGQNAIKSELARKQDIRNAPNSIQSMGRVGSAEAFGINKVDYITFTIHDDVKQRISDYWHKYGFKSLRNKIPSIKTRSNFNFVQTADCNIISSINMNDRLELENIYNKGVTIWHNPSNFMTYNARNEVVKDESEEITSGTTE